MLEQGITRDQKEHHIIKNPSVHQEDIIIPSVYSLNNRASKYMTQNLIELKEK